MLVADCAGAFLRMVGLSGHGAALVVLRNLFASFCVLSGVATDGFFGWDCSLLAAALSSSPSNSKKTLLVRGVEVHQVPLRRNGSDSPYALAVSNVADLATATEQTTMKTSDSSSSTTLPPINFLATQVWPSARSAALALERHLSLLPETTASVCEFGCGPGLPSLTAAALGAPLTYATDLDPFALELVKKAAKQQGFSNRIETKVFDLVNSYTDEIPFADLYLFSDVFECNRVAEGAARVAVECLERRGGTGTVWVFAQSDRAQREIFLNELQRLLQDPSLYWQSSPRGDPEGAVQSNNRLWLCDIDEMRVTYG